MYNYRTMQESIPQWYSNPTRKDCSTTNYWQPNRATKIKHNISMMLPVRGACFFCFCHRLVLLAALTEWNSLMHLVFDARCCSSH